MSIVAPLFTKFQTAPKFGDLRLVSRLGFLFALLILMMMVGRAQVPGEPGGSEKPVQVVEGVVDGNVYSLRQSLKIEGTVREGAIAFGGDVIVQGNVEGDVAAIGGSVVQLAGARIGGDVFVLGGVYRHVDKAPIREQKKLTVMYAGYEEELKEIMRNPSGLLTPRWSPTLIGLRLLSILFWFVISLAVTAAMPGVISRGVARLQLTSLRLAIIGIIAPVALFVAGEACLALLPAPFSVLLVMMFALFALLAWVFGRVVIYAATGRWLQRRFPVLGRNSESVALLVGTAIWVVLTSLPYVWPFVVAITIVLSFGLALTAGRRVAWKKMPVL
jgi:hypothetical protein